MYYLFQGAAGSEAVTVMMGNMSQTAGSSFTYDDNLTPQISDLSPRKTTVTGKKRAIVYHTITLNRLHRSNSHCATVGAWVMMLSGTFTRRIKFNEAAGLC